MKLKIEGQSIAVTQRDGATLTVTQAARQWVCCAAAKAEIRAQYPDEVGGT